MSGLPGRQPPNEPAFVEPAADAEQAARDRELLEFLVEQTWSSYLHKLRTQRER